MFTCSVLPSCLLNSKMDVSIKWGVPGTPTKFALNGVYHRNWQMVDPVLDYLVNLEAWPRSPRCHEMGPGFQDVKFVYGVLLLTTVRGWPVLVLAEYNLINDVRQNWYFLKSYLVNLEAWPRSLDHQGYGYVIYVPWANVTWNSILSTWKPDPVFDPVFWGCRDSVLQWSKCQSKAWPQVPRPRWVLLMPIPSDWLALLLIAPVFIVKKIVVTQLQNSWFLK
jgi:hypothetical protein